MYFLWRIGRTAKREFRDKIPPVSQPPALGIDSSLATQTRLMKWISIGEFKEVLTKCGDLILIDLRTDASGDPFPISTVFVLTVTPNELKSVLDWLPTDRSIVFYGASDRCISMIEKSSCMKGSAPFYVLYDKSKVGADAGRSAESLTKTSRLSRRFDDCLRHHVYIGGCMRFTSLAATPKRFKERRTLCLSTKERSSGLTT